MTVDYLFVIPLTPDSASNETRRELRRLCFQQLQKLKASKKVWLLGAKTTDIADFEAIHTSSRSKEDKLYEAGFLLEKNPKIARYLVRLDDDDLINPAVFDEMAGVAGFDCFADKLHWFYDLSSGRCSAQERPWIPNTAIHKMEHALQKVRALGGSNLADETNFLFACDHSKAWHLYYTGKNVRYANIKNPLYLRVLSPRSRSAGGSDDYQNTFPFYLPRFGVWKHHFPFEANPLHEQLKDIWLKNEGPLKVWSLPRKSFVSRFLNKLNPIK